MGHDDHSHEHHRHEAGDHAGHHHQHDAAVRHTQAELKQGAGKGKVLFFDAFSGVAGDMILGSLLHLGVPLHVVENALSTLPIEGYHLHVGHVQRSGIVATTFQVHETQHASERTYATIERLIAESRLLPEAKQLAQAIFRRLGLAEATIHGISLGEVHFHEVGGVDAIVDIVGAAAALTWLGAVVECAPLPMGRGFVHARHGTLPLPAPAAIECLRGIPTYGVEVDAELVTPTGAAIVATVAERFPRWPSLAPVAVGWGAGLRELPGRPNLLRAVLGEPAAERDASTDTHVIVEANLDDMTGELAAHALSALLSAGALDAWATPITMKKGRPGLTLSALAIKELADTIGATLLSETTSIGVRISAAYRIERPRKIVEVETEFGIVPVKVSDGPFGAPVIKPEFDACVRHAKSAGASVREVIDAALRAFRSKS